MEQFSIVLLYVQVATALHSLISILGIHFLSPAAAVAPPAAGRAAGRAAGVAVAVAAGVTVFPSVVAGAGR